MSFRSSSRCQLHDSPGSHHDLGVGGKVFLSLAITFFIEIFILITAVHMTVTPPLGSKEEISLVMRLGLIRYVKHLLEGDV